MNKFKAVYKDQSTYVNESLARQRGLDDDDIAHLVECHIDTMRILESMENTDIKEDLRELAEQYKAVEFSKQRIWGFEENENMHKWYALPKCICPKMDNDEALGTKYNYVNQHCIIHGTSPTVDS